MVTFNVPDKVTSAGNRSLDSANPDTDKPPISIARRRFMEATFKIIAELTTKRDNEMREREQQEMERIMREQKKSNVPSLPPLFEAQRKTNITSKHGKHIVHAPSKSILVPGKKHGDTSGGTTPRKTPRVRLPDILPEVDTKGPASVYVRKPGGFGMHLSSLVRLARFRKMMSRRDNASHTSEESEIDDDAEDELPRHPRFCATLSPEAQYAMMKGIYNQ